MTATARLHDRLAAIVATTLRVPVASIGPSRSFASLGMDSLAAVELTAAIEDELGIELPLTAVHEHPDLESLRQLLERGADESPVQRRARLLADATLPADIAPPPLRAPLTRDARHILLTGATGFVGAFLLRELLDETDATIHCLVRPGEPGDVRIRRHLASYDLWTPRDADRIRIVQGDLARPNVGLGVREFAELAGEVQAIIHAAADVNWVHSYETLRDANVIGTRELLRLACMGEPKPFHFLSSTSVCHSTAGPRVVDENTDVFSAVDGLRLGYAQSKCVAETLVREAGARGLPVTIIRPSLVSGDARRGRSNVDDLTSRFIAGCIRMHAAPDLDWRMDCVPVDGVARAVVRLARAHDEGASVWHLTPARPRHWRECVLWMRLSGHDVELLPYAEWSDVLRATQDASHPLAGLKSFFLHTIAAENHLTLPELFEESRRSRVSAERTGRSLEALDAEMQAIDSATLSRYFDYFAERNVVPRAPRATPIKRDVEAPLLSISALSRSLRVRIRDVALERIDSEESIIAELTAWRARSTSGLYRARVTHESGQETRLFVKAKAADARSIEVAEALAALASPSLGETIARFRDDLGLTDSHLRELALYAVDERRLRDHTPRAVHIERNDDDDRWILALEALDDATFFDANDIDAWSDAAIDVALAGIAQIHAVGVARGEAEMTRDWHVRRRTAARWIELSPLWSALAEHAAERSTAWSDHRLRRIHARLVEDVAAWSNALCDGVQTLIHNDFNPRNIALRYEPDGMRLCAFDWELAAIGAPQRDLAELLCFVLPPTASHAVAEQWIERYRTLVSASMGIEIPRARWEIGFSASLCELLVDRLASYAMIDRVRPQRFLPRVTRSWLNLFRLFPWTG